jgi:hypothetical protein
LMLESYPNRPGPHSKQFCVATSKYRPEEGKAIISGSKRACQSGMRVHRGTPLHAVVRILRTKWLVYGEHSPGSSLQSSARAAAARKTAPMVDRIVTPVPKVWTRNWSESAKTPPLFSLRPVYYAAGVLKTHSA